MNCGVLPRSRECKWESNTYLYWTSFTFPLTRSKSHYPNRHINLLKTLKRKNIKDILHPFFLTLAIWQIKICSSTRFRGENAIKIHNEVQITQYKVDLKNRVKLLLRFQAENIHFFNKTTLNFPCRETTVHKEHLNLN